MGKTLLEMKDVHKKFPGVYALKSIDFELKEGEVHALLGENGAGKSTLIKVLGGIYIPEQGQLLINGEEVKIESVRAAQNAGVAIIHQEIVLVPEMTVAENIFIGREPQTKIGTIDQLKMDADAQELIDGFGLNIPSTTKVSRLSVAQRQMVEIAKAVSSNCKILVMDEPTSSLTDEEVEFMYTIMRRLTKEGVGIIYISHRLIELFEVADRVTVLRDGQYVGTKVVAETTQDELISMMVGRELTEYYIRTFHEFGDVVFEAKDINAGKRVMNCSFNVRAGEILGFAGLVGAGRSELMKAIMGIDHRDSGTVYLEGKEVDINSPVRAMEAGVVLVPEDRKKEGLILANTVKFNLSLAVLDDFINGVSINEQKELSIVEDSIASMSIKTPSVNQLVGNLSGGNQQKIIIGRWLASHPKVLILDEPTRGVDVGAKAEIYTIVNRLAEEGVAVILISSEMPEVIGMSDRICVMAYGEITGELERKDFDQETIMKYAAGGM